MRKLVSLYTLLMILCSISAFIPFPNFCVVETKLEMIVVPDDYSGIQEAVDASEEGDTVFVRSGSYKGNVVINKSLSLIGEDKETTQITGDQTLTNVLIQHDNVTLKGFTIQGPETQIMWNHKRGVHLLHVKNCVVAENTILRTKYYQGLWLYGSSQNTIKGNTVKGSEGIQLEYQSNNNSMINNVFENNCRGLSLRQSHHNVICGNVFENNNVEIRLHKSDFNLISDNNVTNSNTGLVLKNSTNNHIYHNSFINLREVPARDDSANKWDHGYPSGGNYWSDYNDTDQNGDGIGDTPYIINENNMTLLKRICKMFNTVMTTDRYPLMSRTTYVNSPTLTILSPENTTYQYTEVQLNFTVSEHTSWMGYSLDGGENVTVTGNTTLSRLSDGTHRLTLYANDIFGNMGSSKTVCFTIAQQRQSFPVNWALTALVLVVTLVVAWWSLAKH